MGTNLRVGDVVRIPSWEEGRVTDVLGDDYCQLKVGLYNMVFLAGNVTLLRRPVFAGDVLRHTGDRARPDRDDRLYVAVSPPLSGIIEIRPMGEDSSPSRCAGWLFEHDDGTPIDLPVRDRETMPAPAVRCSRPDCNETIDEKLALRSVQKATRIGSYCSVECADSTMEWRDSLGDRFAPVDRVDAGRKTMGAPATEHPSWADALAEVRSSTPLPSADDLALALFSTDPEVRAVVAEKADDICVEHRSVSTKLQYEGRPTSVSCSVERTDMQRWKRAMDIAWQRDENGLASKAKKRAVEVLAALGGGR